MTQTRIRTILTASLLSGLALVILAWLALPMALLGGVAAGAIIGWLNLYLLVLMIRKMLLEPEAKRSLMLRFFMKYGIIALLIVVAVFVLRVHPLGFAIGISDIVLGVVIGGLWPSGQTDDSEAIRNESEPKDRI